MGKVEDAEILMRSLSVPWPENRLSPADTPGPHDSDARRLFARDGYLIAPGLLPDDLIDDYTEEWRTAHGTGNPDGWMSDGWTDPTPYMRYPALRALATCQPVHDVMHDLFGEPMGLHLNLTGWRSTQRDWHQDGYLNPDSNADWYVAAWMALDDIDADAGPFEFVPGSHRSFPPIRNRKMLDALTPEEAASSGWPTHTERLLTPMFETLMTDRGMHPSPYLPKRGDVLFWHARLLHRGSTPVDPTAERRAVINHYSGVNHRPDMPATRVDNDTDGPYFAFGGATNAV